MKYSQLIDTVAFEASIPDIDALGGWVEQAFQRTYDDLVGAVKYPELYVRDQVVLLTFPNTFQDLPEMVRLDEDSVRFVPGGVLENAYYLTKQNKSSLDEGPARVFQHSMGFIRIWPQADINIGTDQISFNFWRRAFRLGFTNADQEDVYPPQLASTLLKELVAQATAVMGDSKRYQMATALGQRTYSRSFGVTPQDDC